MKDQNNDMQNVSNQDPQFESRSQLENNQMVVVNNRQNNEEVNEKKKNRVPFPIKTQVLSDQIDVIKAKRKKYVRHRKSDPNIAQKNLENELKRDLKDEKILDGFLILHSCGVKYPHQAIKSKLVRENINYVEEGDLNFFQNLTSIDLSENNIKITQLINLKFLVELKLQDNNIIDFRLSEGMFPVLEILNLAFNMLSNESIIQLEKLPSLKILDLTGNQLTNLPDSFDNFKSLEEIILASNLFGSDIKNLDHALLFKSLATIAHLKKLNLARNKLQGIFYEYLEPNSFGHLNEIDFSYNNVFDQSNLLYCEKMKHLQILNITGNPFAVEGETKTLEKALYSTLSCIVINRPIEDPDYLKGKKRKNKEKLPYPKPIASVLNYMSKNVVSKQLYEAELNKAVAFPLAEIEASKELQDEIFPEGMNQEDIFTPPEAVKENEEDSHKKFFITEHNQAQLNEEEFKEEESLPQDNLPERKHKHQRGKLNVQETQSDEEVKMTDIMKGIEGGLIEGSMKEDEDISNFGVNKIRQFMAECNQVLGDAKEYQKIMTIPLAVKALKHNLKFPSTFVTREITSHYMKPTVTSIIGQSMRNAKIKSISKAIRSKEWSENKGMRPEMDSLPPITKKPLEIEDEEAKESKELSERIGTPDKIEELVGLMFQSSESESEENHSSKEEYDKDNEEKEENL